MEGAGGGSLKLARGGGCRCGCDGDATWNVLFSKQTQDGSRYGLGYEVCLRWMDVGMDGWVDGCMVRMIDEVARAIFTCYFK